MATECQASRQKNAAKNRGDLKSLKMFMIQSRTPLTRTVKETKNGSSQREFEELRLVLNFNCPVINSKKRIMLLQFIICISTFSLESLTDCFS